jgi:putative transcriptional regulator
MSALAVLAARGQHPASSVTLLTNQFLIAMPGMKDQHFERAVVYLCEHSPKGAMGLVINKPGEIKLLNLFDKVDLNLNRTDLVDAPVFMGGPVQTDRGFVLHDRMGDNSQEGSFYTSTLAIAGADLEMTTSRDVLEALSEGAGPTRLLVSLGYTGWGAGQLEDEIGRNGWLNVDASSEIIFEIPVEQRYEKALALLGINPAMLSMEAGHA